METQKPLSAKEAADYLGLALPTLYSKVSRGELPHYKPAKKLYFYKEQLDEYIQNKGEQK